MSERREGDSVCEGSSYETGSAAHTLLSDRDIAHVSIMLQVYADLFPVRPAGSASLRSYQRQLADV